MEWSQWRYLRVALFFLLNVPCGGTVGPALCLKLALLFGHLVCTMPFQRPARAGVTLKYLCHYPSCPGSSSRSHCSCLHHCCYCYPPQGLGFDRTLSFSMLWWAIALLSWTLRLDSTPASRSHSPRPLPRLLLRLLYRRGLFLSSSDSSSCRRRLLAFFRAFRLRSFARCICRFLSLILRSLPLLRLRASLSPLPRLRR